MKEGFRGGFFRKQERAQEAENTPMRFRLAVETALKGNFRAVEMQGEEHLAELPPDAKVVFATTHISDMDVVMPIAKLGKRFKMRAVNASLQHEFSEDPASKAAMKLIGEENILPVDMKWGTNPETGEKEYYTKRFNPENFVPMEQALEGGEAIVMAAYTPTAVKDGKLPAKGGNGAVYLAAATGAYIVPVAVDILSEDAGAGVRRTISRSMKSRPVAVMHVGKPIPPKEIANVKQLGEYIEHPGEGAGRQEIREKRKHITELLRNQSEEVMRSLAGLLPEERRGSWGEKSAKEVEENDVLVAGVPAEEPI